MQRLTDDDKHIGKRITYGKSDKSHFRLIFTTDVDEDERSGHNALFISLFGLVIRIILPEIVKPYQHKVMAQNWDAATIARMGRDHYFIYFDREYGFSIYENYLQVMYGTQGDMHYAFSDTRQKEKRIGVFLPWTEYRIVKNDMYDANMNLVWSERFDMTSEQRREQPDRYKIMGDMTRKSFKFRDYDGEEIIVDTHVEHRVWKRGTKAFKWLSWFMPNIDKRILELQFRKEVGPRKGEWKGGLMGMGYQMKPGETMEETFQRWCEETKTKKDRHLRPVEYIGVAA